MLESAGEEPMASLAPVEEALLLGEDPESQLAQVSAPHIPINIEEALRPKVTAGVAGPLDIQQQIPSLLIKLIKTFMKNQFGPL